MDAGEIMIRAYVTMVLTLLALILCLMVPFAIVRCIWEMIRKVKGGLWK